MKGVKKMKNFAASLMRIFSIVLLVGIIMFPFSAKADTVSMWFTGVNGQSSYGYYIDPYIATVNGVPGTPIYCVDFNREVNFGDTWTANVTSLTASSFNNTYLKNLQTYETMAWLISQLPSADSTNKAAIQWVIWDLSLGKEAHSSYFTQYSYWLSQAEANYTTIDPTKWQILTDINGVKQEFMVDPPVTQSVPEPGALVLLSSGLVGLASFGTIKKKLRK